MKKVVCFIASSMLCFGLSLAQEKIDLEKKEKIDFENLMQKNNVIHSVISDIDLDSQGNLYFLDFKYCCILKIDQKTGALIKRMASKGQGPGELDQPWALRVRNNKIYVADAAFCGVKIFDMNGNPISQFHTFSPPREIDVDEKDRVYICQYDIKRSTLISIYSDKGEVLKNFINIDHKKSQDPDYFVRTTEIKYSIDKKGDLVILYRLKKTLIKYNSEGKILWERQIRNSIVNPIIKAYDKNKDVTFKKGSVSFTPIFFDLDINDENKILVGHINGGALYNESGTLGKVLSVKGGMQLFRWIDKELMIVNPLFGDIKKYLEVLK